MNGLLYLTIWTGPSFLIRKRLGGGGSLETFVWFENSLGPNRTPQKYGGGGWAG